MQVMLPLSSSSCHTQYGQTPFSGVIATYIGYLGFVGLAVIGYVSSPSTVLHSPTATQYTCIHIQTGYMIIYIYVYSLLYSTCNVIVLGMPELIVD